MGAMFAGVTVVTWYPITPSSSLVESLIDYMKAYRIGPDGKATFAIVQAEDELAAIGMVLGAGWAGARSMTATAGPGISLMSEFAGLGYYVEIPGVIWDIQRVGPSTGLPTRTSQGDISSWRGSRTATPSTPCCIPSTPARMFHHGERSLRSGRAAADAGVRHVGSRSRHEQLDVGAVRISRQAAEARQGADRGGPRAAGRIRALQRCGRRCASAIAPCPAPTIPTRRGSRAAAATTRSRNTASVPTTTPTTWIGWRESSRRRERWCPSRRWSAMTATKSGIIAYGTSHHARGRIA